MSWAAVLREKAAELNLIASWAAQANLGRVRNYCALATGELAEALRLTPELEAAGAARVEAPPQSPRPTIPEDPAVTVPPAAPPALARCAAVAGGAALGAALLVCFTKAFHPAAGGWGVAFAALLGGTLGGFVGYALHKIGPPV